MSMSQRLDAADALPGAAELRARTYELLRLEPGSAVLDVGCGAGLAVSEFLVGDAYALPVVGGFAGYRADKMFHELAEPERALAEARRVLAPGGRIVLSGPDWEALMIDSSYPALTREIVRARASVVAAPRIARGFRRLLAGCGFRKVSVEGVVGFLGWGFVLSRVGGRGCPGGGGFWLVGALRLCSEAGLGVAGNRQCR